MAPPVRSVVSLVAVVLVVLAACGDPGPTTVPSPPAPIGGRVDVLDTESNFQLRLSLPASTFRAREPITGEARLTTVDGRAAGIAGSGSGVIGFSFREIGGTRSMGGVMTSDCAPHTIPAGGGLRAGLRPAAAFSGDDPNADFYRAFSLASDVRLPAGTWEITAHARFMSAGCNQPEHDLSAPIVVTVTP